MAEDNIFQKVADFYNDLVATYGHDTRACDYGDQKSQLVKFEVLSEVAPLDGKKILDVGCGFADFADFLINKYEKITYEGIDVSPKMIEEAKRLHKDIKLEEANILDVNKSSAFDIVAANGIFYLLGEEAPSLMKKIIVKMYETARTAIAFNSLSSWARDKEPGEFYADPLETLDFCRTLSPRVVLRHDYHPRDFTIYIYKNV